MSLHRVLAAVVFGAGLLAAVVGSPYPRAGAAPASGRLAVESAGEIAARVERGQDRIAASEVAEWLRERRARLRIVDLRSPEEFAADHLPTSESLALHALVTTGFAADETVVLVSTGDALAAQGWALLAARGVADVRVVTGGYDAWLREVLYPELARDAAPEVQAAFARRSELSRYFGGRPRVVDSAKPTGAAAETVAQQAARTRRGGC